MRGTSHDLIQWLDKPVVLAWSVLLETNSILGFLVRRFSGDLSIAGGGLRTCAIEFGPNRAFHRRRQVGHIGAPKIVALHRPMRRSSGSHPNKSSFSKTCREAASSNSALQRTLTTGILFALRNHMPVAGFARTVRAAELGR